MTKFVDCLVQLPNLKVLEILSVSSRAHISKALRQKRARFPSIRELRITHECHLFIKDCPNLEILTLTDGFGLYSPITVRSHGRGLRHIAGVNVYTSGLGMDGELVIKLFNLSGHLGRHMTAIARGCPNLREIGIVGRARVSTLPGVCGRCMQDPGK